MARVIGIGGVFFKTDNPAETQAWYQKNMGFVPEQGSDSTSFFLWRQADDPSREHHTVWSAFGSDTTYFDPTTAPYMINYIVDNLDEMLQQLRDGGAKVDDEVEDYAEFGRFGWAVDPNGVRFELWEPPDRQG